MGAVVASLRGDGRGWTLLAIAGGWFFALGLRFTIPALLPAIRADFPVSETVAGAAITLLWVTYAAMQFPAGVLVDRVGERTLLVGSAGTGALTMVAYAVAPTFALFVLATAAFGFASGLYGPPRGTVLTRTYTDSDGAAFGIVLAAGSIGAALVPPLATYATGVVGWRGALGLTAPGFLLAAVALGAFVPAQSTVDAARRTDGDEAAAEAETEPQDRPLTARLRAAAGDVRRGVSSRKVVLAMIGTTLMLFAFQGLTAFLTTYLVTAKALSEATAGTLFGLLFLSAAVFQSTGGALADRYGYGTVLSIVAFVGIGPLLALPFAEGIVPLVVIVLLLGMRLVVGPVANAYIVALLPADVRGTAWGAIRTSLFVVGAFGSTAVGAMADHDLYTAAFVLLAVLTAIAGVIYAYLPNRDEVTDLGNAE
ncbi:Sugar phosphate permease [Halobellus clavatus]|uniref:Sugar phosphate permease n=1 Tax=Halobellus clavatus TaxID=660517 RepID=A0A1H3HVB2_9EURY|nr:Sugar phosphate permease [Halobellus clavatus]